MAAVDATPSDTRQVPSEGEASPVGLLAGDPLALGLPSFIVGSVALGLVLIGFVPAAAVGASLPIILSATAIGLWIATLWAMSVGQSAVACVFGVFGGFWLSYAVLVTSLTHNWFGVTAADAVKSEELFLTAWLIAIVLLTIGTLRLPLAFTAILGLVDVALLLVLLGTSQASTGLLKAGGVVVFIFAAVGAYVFFGTAAAATGGPGVPLGNPVLHD